MRNRTESRRSFIKRFSLSAGALVGLGTLRTLGNAGIGSFANKVSIFSKNLQWLNYEDMAIVAKDIGFNGIDLTVRPNGHVLPERVTTDLPEAVNIIRKKGIDVISVTTAITDTTDEYVDDILATLRDLGIQYYRLNWFSYDQIASMDENLSRMKVRMEKLARLNERYGLHGAYQNHSGTSFGASVWDLWQTLKDLDPQHIGCQFDVRHAMVEGGHSWVNDFKIIQPWIKTLNVKDFVWQKQNNKWEAESVPLGEGMVDFKQYFELLRLHDIKAPICIHYEYPLGGADQGARTITLPREKVIQALKKDFDTLHTWLQ